MDRPNLFVVSLSDHVVHYPASLPSSRLSTKEQFIICNVFQPSYKQPPPKYHLPTLLCKKDRHLEKEGCRGVAEVTFLHLLHIFSNSLCPQKLILQESGVKIHLRIQLKFFSYVIFGRNVDSWIIIWILFNSNLICIFIGQFFLFIEIENPGYCCEENPGLWLKFDLFLVFFFLEGKTSS